jgi:hypothetical protein
MRSPSATLARRLAGWASGLTPTREDLALATRSMRDTLAGTVAARNDDIRAIVADSPEPLGWASIGHVLDFDDPARSSATSRHRI